MKETVTLENEFQREICCFHSLSVDLSHRLAVRAGEAARAHAKVERKHKCGCKPNPYFQVHFEMSYMLGTRKTSTSRVAP